LAEDGNETPVDGDLGACSFLSLLAGMFISCDDDDDDSGGGDDDDDGGGPTWSDPTTGLDWQRAVDNSQGLTTCYLAGVYCDGLNLDGQKNWRLPTVSELRSLVRGCEATVTGGSCGVTDDCLLSSGGSCWGDSCEGCSLFGGPGPGGAYWPAELSGPTEYPYVSASPVPDYYTVACWEVGFSGGLITFTDYYAANVVVRCVR
jgi:hypothetical protein